MDYEETDSDDDNKLQIVESQPGLVLPTRPALIRSLSALDPLRSGSDEYDYGDSEVNSDAVESLLLLGQQPVVAPKNGNDEIGGVKTRRYRSNAAEQRMMVNYYQRMRERNNEASKRCRLKRRIKQDSLEKTRLLLESQQDLLKNRVAKLNKIRDILNMACRAAGNNAKNCECINFRTMIRNCHNEMPDESQYSNIQLIKKSRCIRETNLEEIIGANTPEMTDMRPLKRGPRKVDTDTNFSIDTDSMTIKPESPANAGSGALDLSSGSKAVPAPVQHKPVNLIKIGSPPHGVKLEHDIKPVSFVTLAPKPSTVIVDNNKKLIPAPNLVPVFSSADQNSKSTISFGNLNGNGTTTILLTPLGGPSTVLNLPINPSSQIFPKQPADLPNMPNLSSKPPPMELLINKNEPEVLIKSEPDIENIDFDKSLGAAGENVVIPENPSSNSCIIGEKEEVIKSFIKTEQEDIAMDIVDTKAEKDPTMSCAAVLAGKEDPLTCSSDLVDLNGLKQTLDLVTMEPSSAGDLTSMEKYIIKSRLEMAFWEARESASFICSSHRAKIIQESNLHCCSICGKKRSRKLDMYIITYRMSVEFYMTNGQFLSIGQLACSLCKGKCLKGLDFSNSYILPETGHPLAPSSSVEIVPLPVKSEAVDQVTEVNKSSRTTREIILHRDVVLPSSTTSQGKLATIQPLPQIPIPPQSKLSVKCLTGSSLSSSTASLTISQQSSPPPRPDSTRARQDLNDALSALNPDYEPLGFTINSLSNCSEGVLRDTVRASKMAISTVLSSIAPGQESALWQIIKPEMESLLANKNTQSQT